MSFDRNISNRSDLERLFSIVAISAVSFFNIIQVIPAAPFSFSVFSISCLFSGLTSSLIAILMLLCSISSASRLSISVSTTLQYCAGGVSFGKKRLPAFHMLTNLCSIVSVSKM